MTDRLSLTNALADANIDRQKAERIATEIFDAIHENVATKADIDRLGTRIDQVESSLKTDMAAVRAEMRELELRLEARVDQVESGLKELELRLEVRIDRIVVRLGSVMVVLVGIILAAIRYLPHS